MSEREELVKRFKEIKEHATFDDGEGNDCSSTLRGQLAMIADAADSAIAALSAQPQQVNAEDDGYASAHPRPFFDPSAPQSEQTHVRVPDYDRFGYALAMRVLQSDLYRQLDERERSECDELIRAATGKESE